ncbi:MAG TPA: hypothetical protein VGE01_10735 [Fimbriimonas sp.]
MAMGAYFLFAWQNVLGIVFGLIFLIAGGRSMRAAWFPFGRLLESLFWLGIYGLVFLVTLVARSSPGLLSSNSGEANLFALIIGLLLGYSLWDTYRSIRFVIHVLKVRDERNAEGQSEPEDRDR